MLYLKSNKKLMNTILRRILLLPIALVLCLIDAVVVAILVAIIFIVLLIVRPFFWLKKYFKTGNLNIIADPLSE